MVPASRLVIRTQQENRLRTRLMPVDRRPLQSQVHDSAKRTLDCTTADRQPHRRHSRVVHPTLAAVPLEVVAFPFQRLAWPGTTRAIDRRLHLLEPTLE